MLTETETKLEQWGRWVRAGGVIPRYQSSAAILIKAMVQQPGLGITISDDLATLVDQKVARLKARDPEMGEAVMTYYVTGCDLRKLGKKMGCGKERARLMLNSGVAWVDAALEAANDSGCD